MLVTVPSNDAVTLARLRSSFGADIVDLDPHRAPQPELEQKATGSLLQRPADDCAKPRS
jgi:hypothetical protein